MVFDFIDGGAETEATVVRNRSAFEEILFRPRVCRDVSVRKQSTVLFERSFETPILLAPVGMARLAGHAGELAAADAADHAGTVSVVSTGSAWSFAEVAAHATQPQWFQLYPWGDREQTRRLIDIARNAGYEAMVLTADVPVAGGRERDIYNGMMVPLRKDLRTGLDVGRHPRWLAEVLRHPKITPGNLESLFPELGRHSQTLAAKVASLLNPEHVWSDVDWIREAWNGPLLLKGVMTAEDAVLAIERGCDGVIVSNHGGRQCDYLEATIEALPAIVAAVSGRGPVLMDGGIRRGTDVLKALALGASAVLVGRPWVYGLGALGARGPYEALRILADELDRSMALLGVSRLDELGPELLAGPFVSTPST